MAIAVRYILKKHKHSENPRIQIAKDILILGLTLVTLIFLSGLAAMLTNFYVSLNFGAVVGLISALGVSFVIGYAVKKGIGRFI